MKLYLFYDVFIDYTGGIAGAIAKTRSEAIDIIVTQYEKDNDIIKNIDKKKKIISSSHISENKKSILLKKLYKYHPDNHLGTLFGYINKSKFRKELEKCKKVIKVDVNKSYGFYIGGGS